MNSFDSDTDEKVFWKVKTLFYGHVGWKKKTKTKNKTKILFFDNFSQFELKITKLTFKHHFDMSKYYSMAILDGGKKKTIFFFSDNFFFSSQFGLKITKSTFKHHSLGENVVLGPYWVKLKKKKKKKFFINFSVRWSFRRWSFQK